MKPNSALLLLLASAAAFGGQFVHGLGSKDEVAISIPRPPDAIVKAKNLRIQWDTSTRFGHADHLRQMIEQALSKEFAFSDQNPDATIRLVLLGFEPGRENRTTQNESRPVKVGEKPIYDKNGKQVGKQDIIENRVVPVEYWEGNAGVKISVAVVDKSGVVIDGFAPTGQFHNKMEIAINGESKLGHSSLPTPAALEGTTLEQVARQMTRRYTATTDPATVTLACDGELRTGNKLAQSGQWAEALESWKGATLKKNKADRTFNMAVAREVFAYKEYAQSQSLEQMLPVFQEAMNLYEQALKEDPNEKYMRRQVERLTLAKANIDNVRKQYELQKEEARKAEEEARRAIEARLVEERKKQELRSAVDDKRPDATDEARFRPMARMRLTAMQGDISEQQASELVAFGQRTYQLTELNSYRVVWQEVRRKRELAQKTKDYEDMFAPLVSGGKLSLAARTQLLDLRKTLELEDADVHAVEARYKFVEETRAAKAPAGAVAKKQTTAAVKPAVPPAKPATAAKADAPKPAAATGAAIKKTGER